MTTAARINSLADRYDGRISSYLELIREAIDWSAHLATGEVLRLPPLGDQPEHEWSLTVFVGGTADRPAPTDVDVRFVLMDSEVQDAIPAGVNFGLEVVNRFGDTIACALVDRNTDEGGWVDMHSDLAAEERFLVTVGTLTPDQVAAAIGSYSGSITTKGGDEKQGG